MLILTHGDRAMTMEEQSIRFHWCNNTSDLWSRRSAKLSWELKICYHFCIIDYLYYLCIGKSIQSNAIVTKSKYPIGVQSFEKLRSKGYHPDNLFDTYPTDDLCLSIRPEYCCFHDYCVLSYSATVIQIFLDFQKIKLQEWQDWWNQKNEGYSPSFFLPILTFELPVTSASLPPPKTLPRTSTPSTFFFS